MPEVAKAATLHITEILGEEQIEELHLCEECAHKYLYEPSQNQAGKNPGHGDEVGESSVLNRQCDVCGVKFVDFRNSGRLGCPHDYEVFRDELMPLLENIHGETKHCGKTPTRCLPQNKLTQSELIHLCGKQLGALQAVNSKEAYEEAGRFARPDPARLEES